MGKTQNHPLRAFTPSEEQELYGVAHATSERLDAVKQARALLSVQAGRPFTDAARESGYKSGDSISQLVERFNQRGVQPLSVVDNSALSPINLTVHSDPPYDQEALSFSHFQQRGSL